MYHPSTRKSELGNLTHIIFIEAHQIQENRMSHCISNATFYQPSFSVSQKISSYPRFPKLLYPNYISCKAMSTHDGRANLDHLQRTETPQRKRKLPQSAPIGMWDRFPRAGTVEKMMETMERLMEDPFAYSREWSSSPMATENASAAGGYSRGRTPWEIKEGEKEYKMRFDMPGMTKQDVKVWVEEKMLVLKAEKEGNKKGKDDENNEAEEGDVWSAKSYGRYSCRIALPENVQFEKIKAEVKDGVLYITIPKVEVVTKILDINVE